MSDPSPSADAPSRAIRRYDREEMIKIGQKCQGKPLPEGVSLADFSLIDPATLEPERTFERRSLGDDGPSFKPAWAKGGRGGEGGVVRPSYPVPIRSKLVDIPPAGDDDGAVRGDRCGALSHRSSWRGGEDRAGGSYTDRDRDRDPRGPRDGWEASRSPSGPPGIDRGAPPGQARGRWGPDRDKDGWRSNSLKEDRWRGGGGDDGGDRRGPGPDREPPGYSSRDGLAGVPGRDDRERWGRRPGALDEGFQEDSGRWTDERRRRVNDPPPPPRGHYGDRDRDRDHRSSGDYHRAGGGDYYPGGGGHEPEWMAEEDLGGDGRRGGGGGGNGGGGAAREERHTPIASRSSGSMATRLTAADVERERQAFRAMANKEKEAPKPKHGLFDMEEIDLDELRDEDDEDAMAPSSQSTQQQQQPPCAGGTPRTAMGVEELERRMAAGTAAPPAAAGASRPVPPPPGFGGPSAPAPPPGFGAPPPAALPAGPTAPAVSPVATGFPAPLGGGLGALGGNAAGKALLGMLKKGASGDALVPQQPLQQPQAQAPQQPGTQSALPSISAPPAPAVSALLPPGFPPAIRPGFGAAPSASLSGPPADSEQRQDQQQLLPPPQPLAQQQQQQRQQQQPATQPMPTPPMQQQPAAPPPPPPTQQQPVAVSAPLDASALERPGSARGPLPTAVLAQVPSSNTSAAASAPQTAGGPGGGMGAPKLSTSFPPMPLMPLVSSIPEGVRNAFADARFDSTSSSGTSMAPTFSNSFGNIWGTSQIFSQPLKPQEPSSVPQVRPATQQPAAAAPAGNGGSNSGNTNATINTSGGPPITTASANSSAPQPVRQAQPPLPQKPQASQLPSSQSLLPPQQQPQLQQQSQLPPQLQALLGIQPQGQQQPLQQQQASSAAGLGLFQQQPSLGQQPQQQQQQQQQGGINVRSLPESHPLHALFVRAASSNKQQQPSQVQQQQQAAHGHSAPQPHAHPQLQQPQGAAPPSGLTPGQPRPGGGMDPLSLLLGQLGRAQAQQGPAQQQPSVATGSGPAGLQPPQVHQQPGGPPYGQRLPFGQPAAPPVPQNAMQQLQQQLQQLQFGAGQAPSVAAPPTQAPPQPPHPTQGQGTNVVAQLHQMLQAAQQQQQQVPPALPNPGAPNFLQQLMASSAASAPGAAVPASSNFAALQALHQLQALQAGAAVRGTMAPASSQQLPPHLQQPAAGAFPGPHGAHQPWPQAMALNPALAAAAAAAATRPGMPPPMGGGSGGGGPSSADASSLARFLSAAALQAAAGGGTSGGHRLPLTQAPSMPSALQGVDLERLLQMQAITRQQTGPR